MRDGINTSFLLPFSFFLSSITLFSNLSRTMSRFSAIIQLAKLGYTRDDFVKICSSLIGQKGSGIQTLTKMYPGLYIQVFDSRCGPDFKSPARDCDSIKISARSSNDVSDVAKEISRIAQATMDGTLKRGPEITVSCPLEMVAKVIGRGGNCLHKIQQTAGDSCHIYYNQTNGLFEISATSIGACSRAKIYIESAIKKLTNPQRIKLAKRPESQSSVSGFRCLSVDDEDEDEGQGQGDQGQGDQGQGDQGQPLTPDEMMRLGLTPSKALDYHEVIKNQQKDKTCQYCLHMKEDELIQKRTKCLICDEEAEEDEDEEEKQPLTPDEMMRLGLTPSKAQLAAWSLTPDEMMRLGLTSKAQLTAWSKPSPSIKSSEGVLELNGSSLSSQYPKRKRGKKLGGTNARVHLSAQRPTHPKESSGDDWWNRV